MKVEGKCPCCGATIGLKVEIEYGSPEKIPPKNVYVIYTDGSCLGNPGPGGWAYSIHAPNNGTIHCANGHSDSTTNNRMEVTAALMAIGELVAVAGNKVSIMVCSDSDYLVRTMNGEFRKKTNTDLWSAMDHFIAEKELVDVTWKYLSDKDENIANCHERAQYAAKGGKNHE